MCRDEPFQTLPRRVVSILVSGSPRVTRGGTWSQSGVGVGARREAAAGKLMHPAFSSSLTNRDDQLASGNQIAIRERSDPQHKHLGSEQHLKIIMLNESFF